MRAGLRTRGGAAGRCQRIGMRPPARPLAAALIALRSVTHHSKRAQELSVCVAGSEDGSPFRRLTARPSFISNRDSRLYSLQLDRKDGYPLEGRLWLSIGGTASLSNDKRPRWRDTCLKVQSDTDMYLPLSRRTLDFASLHAMTWSLCSAPFSCPSLTLPGLRGTSGSKEILFLRSGPTASSLFFTDRSALLRRE